MKVKTIDKIRKISVMGFICAGLGAGVFEHVTALPQYEGTGSGFAGDVTLSVAMDGNKIDAINIVGHSETEGISDPAFSEVIPAILGAQDLNVDDVAGATYTSTAIKEAVQEAAAKAGLDLEIVEAVKEEVAVETGRGVTGTGDGYLDDIVVEVEKEGDTIKNIWVISHGDTDAIATPAFEELTATIIQSQSTDVDMIAGATWTSEGFVEAVEDSLEKIDEMSGWITTTGTGDGYLDDINVEVSKSGDEIVDIKVVYHGDTDAIATPAFEELREAVLDSQSADVDMVAGATWTSEGFIEAVEEALNKN